MVERLRQMAQQAGLPMNPPSMISSSRRALEAAEYARVQGKHHAFHTAIFRSYFQAGKDIGDWATLLDVAQEVGLIAERMRKAVERGVYRAAVDAQIREARQLGITSVPTFVLDNLAIVGAQPYEVFQQTMVRLGIAPARGKR